MNLDMTAFEDAQMVVNRKELFMFSAKLRKIIIIVSITLASLVVVGYLLLNLISWVLYSRSVNDINIKSIDTVQFFKEKFGVTIIDGVEVQNVGKITVSGLSPDGTSIMQK